MASFNVFAVLDPKALPPQLVAQKLGGNAARGKAERPFRFAVSRHRCQLCESRDDVRAAFVSSSAGLFSGPACFDCRDALERRSHSSMGPRLPRKLERALVQESLSPEVVLEFQTYAFREELRESKGRRRRAA